jgi:hypothetical protein
MGSLFDAIQSSCMWRECLLSRNGAQSVYIREDQSPVFVGNVRSWYVVVVVVVRSGCCSFGLSFVRVVVRSGSYMVATEIR